MKIKRYLVHILCVFQLVSCTPISKLNQLDASGVDEKHPSVLSSVEKITHYPPCKLKDSDTEGVPHLRNPRLNLPNGLILEEYSNEFIWPYQEDRGCLYANRNRVSATQITLDNSVHILVTKINETREIIKVIQDENVVFNSEIRPYIYSGLLEAWSYDDHWCIEIISIDADEVIEKWSHVKKSTLYEEQKKLRSHIEIICDGQYIKNENDYEEVFSFQVLDGKPLFFYKKNSSFGINYDGKEASLLYDTLSWNSPHPGFDRFVFQFENMVFLSAERDSVWYEVVIGIFD